MSTLRRFLLLAANLVIGVGLLAAQAPRAQQKKSASAPDPARPGTGKADAYYNFSMAHLYSELAAQFGNRSEYLQKAIEFYRAAVKADPTASFLSEGLSDLYIQSGQAATAVREAEEALKANADDLNARRVLARIYYRMIGDARQNKVNEEYVKKAIEQYSRIVDKAPTDVDSWNTLGQLHRMTQNVNEAEKDYQKALALDAENEDALTGLAEVYSSRGDNKKATELLERATVKNPSLRTLAELAGNYEQMRDYKLAAEVLRRALQMSQGNPELRRAYAENLFRSEQFNEALAEYQQLTEDEPRDWQGWLRISQIQRQNGKTAEARQAIQKAREADPNNLEVRYQEINLLESEGKQPEAIQALKDMIASTVRKSYSPGEQQNRALLYERLGLLYRNNGQYKEAADSFRELGLLGVDFGPRSASQLMETWRAAKDWTKATEEAEAANKKYPRDRMVKLVRANILAETGKSELAASELKSLLDGKSDREVYLSLAQIHDKGKNYVEMAKAIDQAEKLSESAEEKEGVWFTRGAMLEKQKKFDLAEAEFRKLLAQNPDNVGALNYLGYMLADRNVKLEEALAMIQKALQKDPDNGAYLDSLGWALFRLNRYPEAEDNLRKSIEKVPTDPTVRDHLGDVYYKQGKLKEAVAEWQASVQQFKVAAAHEYEAADLARVQRKLDSARVRAASTKDAPAKKP
ncbi:MAG: tetratricopeptide repeat protein [Bryobacteraceae bacterium]|nr:tetratricopeptide repeat protein [Bryobacteraceae bacterium]